LLEIIKGYSYILTSRTCIGFIGISNETSGSNTSSTSLITCSTKFKPTNVINLIGWFNEIDVKTTMVPIENNHGSMANIKSSSSLDILEWKS